MTVTLRPGDTPPVVRSSINHAVVAATGETVDLKGVRLSLFGDAPAGAPLRWEVSWQDGPEWRSALAPGSDTPQGRSVVVDLQFPVNAFEPENSEHDYAVSVRPRVLINAGLGTYATLPYALTVALADPPRSPRSSPYRLIQGSPLLGFGGQIDATGQLGVQAQKTTVAKVDLDRVPIGGDYVGEDVDLHPRKFKIHNLSKRNEYAYALILKTPDRKFGRLELPSFGKTPLYQDDVEKGITGRDINAPGEPVAIHSAIGGQIMNLGVAGTNGEYRISAGATPGLDP